MFIRLNKDIILLNPQGNCEELLEKLQLPFSVIHRDFTMDFALPTIPFEFANNTVVVKLLRMQKPQKSICYMNVKRVVSLNGLIMRLPRTRNEAISFFRRLSNNRHKVTTAVGIRCDEQLSSFVVQSDVTMHRLTEKIIAQYVETGEPFEQDVGYNIMGVGQNLVKRIDGSKYNVAGLPLDVLRTFLTDRKIITVEKEEKVHGN
ncbi:Maf family protein [Rummeliibacillus pycnus]|uniref:Maf family protein n=1 Tax=Rummeliibacillus pycnus TaxID=101070 RepID=UPI003D2DFDDA